MLAVTPYPSGFVLPPEHIHTFRPFYTHHIHPWTRLGFGSTKGRLRRVCPRNPVIVGYR
jgi:hypothetical protein